MANHDVGSAGPTFNVVFRKFLGLRADERSAEENALLESMQPVVTSHNGTPSTSYTWFDVRGKVWPEQQYRSVAGMVDRAQNTAEQCPIAPVASTPSRLVVQIAFAEAAATSALQGRHVRYTNRAKADAQRLVAHSF